MYLAGALTRGNANPILRNGPSAGVYDSTKAGPHCVVEVTDGDYRMWYEAIKDDANQTTTVAYATSVDGTTWTKYGSNPVMSPAGWENLEVSPQTVFYDPADAVWKMWYHGGVTNGVGTRKIGYATSSDGITWSKSGSNPILTVGTAGAWDDTHVDTSKVIKFGATDYRMWYRGVDSSNVAAVGYATSSDGITWSKSGSNPVFQAGSAGQWDDGLFLCFHPLFFEGIFHAWYIAGDAPTGYVDQIGYAWSTDGLSWNRGPNNPILGDITGEDVTDTIHVRMEGNRARVTYGHYDLGASPALRGIGEGYFDGLIEPRQDYLIDDFNRADDATPPPGANWTNGSIFTNAGTDGIAIVSNQACRQSTGAYRQGGFWNAQKFGQDFDYVAEISSLVDTDFDEICFFGRGVDLGTSGADGITMRVSKNGASQDWFLGTVLNQTETTLNAAGTPRAISAGDLVALQAVGATLRAWHKPSGGIWNLVVEKTSTASMFAGHAGMEFTGNQSGKVTNWWMTNLAAPVTAGFSLPARMGVGVLRFLAGSPAFVDIPVAGGTAFPQDVTGTATTTATITNQIGKIVSATSTTTASIVKQAGKIVSATATSSATIVKQVAKTLAGTASSTASLSAIKVFLMALTATVTTTATMIRQIGKIVSATSTTTATIVKQVGKILSATVTSTATLSAIRAFLKTMTATVTTTATITRSVGKVLSTTATVTASIVKQVGKRLSATSTTTATLAATRAFLKAMTATATTTATISRSVGKAVVATATVSGTITKQVGKRLTATVSTIASMVADFVSGSNIVVTGRFDRPKPGGSSDANPDAGEFDRPNPRETM